MAAKNMVARQRLIGKPPSVKPGTQPACDNATSRTSSDKEAKLMQKTLLIGYLGKDPEMKYSPGGTAITTFTIASTERWKDSAGEPQEHTEWFFDLPTMVYFFPSERASERCSSMRCLLPSSLVVAPCLISSMTCGRVSDGSSANSLAAKFTTLGVAMDVGKTAYDDKS
jgi:hypothetical protein